MLAIRLATPADAGVVAELSSITFKETYWGTDTDENILQHIDAYFNEEQICTEIEDANANWYFIAYLNEQPVGYIRLRHDILLKPDYLQSKEALEVARLYVLKAFHGQKIGWQLLQQAEKFAEQLQCEVIWLCVWKENQKALLFYQQGGFELAGEYLFQLGTSTYIDWAMTKKL